ncbi:MAG: COB-i1 protein [Microgenomates group bacterium Gr01-1014_5]|nr:MAG: COB-i1 protein [Microgenomates group bacterium Gr01-1014_5]
MRTIPREVYLNIKSSFVLNNNQKAVLIGTLLGDGGIRLKGKFARLHIKHSLNQLPLVEYKRQVFSNITTMDVSVFKQKVGKVDYNFAEFVTLTHQEFLEYYRLFYPTRRKIVPINIGQFLTSPLSLAIWIMDDGSAEYAGVSIQTHSFSQREVDLLRKTLTDNFNIETGSRLNKGKWIIYFPKSSLSKLRNLIDKFMLEEFKYKLVPYSLSKPRRDYTPTP